MNGSLYITDPEGENLQPRGCLHGFWIIIVAVLVTVALCIIFPGCKSLPPAVVPQVHNEHTGHTADNTSKEHDHLTVRDSIIYRWQHDTLYVDRWHTEFRDRWKHDSIHIHDSIHVQDSIPYPVYLEKPVPYKSGYTKFTSWFFWILVIVFLLWAAWKICDKIPATKPYTAVIRGILKIGKFF